MQNKLWKKSLTLDVFHSIVEILVVEEAFIITRKNSLFCLLTLHS